MTNGRNTTVLSVRVTDDFAKRLRQEAKKRKLCFSDYLKMLLTYNKDNPPASDRPLTIDS